MTPILLAPCLVADDLLVSDLLHIAGFPTDDTESRRGNLLRAWRREGLIEPFALRASGRPWSASEDTDAPTLAHAVRGALEAGFCGSLAALARQLGEVDADGRASRRLEHVVEALVDAGAVLPLRAVRLTPAGRAVVEALPGALEIAERERAARASARRLARLSDEDVRELAVALGEHAHEDPAVALARLTRGAPVPRASVEEPGRVGLPQRVVPARFRMAVGVAK